MSDELQPEVPKSRAVPAVAIIEIVGGILQWLIKVRDEARRNQTWTVAQEEAYSEHIENQFTQAHWQTDIDPAPELPKEGDK